MNKQVCFLIAAAGAVLLVPAACASLGAPANASLRAFAEQSGIDIDSALRGLYSFARESGDGDAGRLFDDLAAGRYGLRYEPAQTAQVRVAPSGAGRPEIVVGRLPAGLDAGNSWVYAAGLLAAAAKLKTLAPAGHPLETVAGNFYRAAGQYRGQRGYAGLRYPDFMLKGMQEYTGGAPGFAVYAGTACAADESSFRFR